MLQYDNSGILYKNKAPKSDKSPGYLGKLTVAGVEYDLAAWVRENDKGKFFSLKVTPKWERPQPTPAAAPAPTDTPF